MTHRSFVLTFIATCLAVGIAYAASIRLLSPAPIAGEHWIQGAETVKRQLASRELRPRVLLFGGSSTLFSISADQLSDEIGQPAFNLGLHAGLPLRYHLNLAREVAGPGDLVIVAPEYGYYRTNDPNTVWLTRQALAWNSRYLDQLSYWEWLSFAASTSPSLLIEAAVASIFRDRILFATPGRAVVSTDEAMRRHSEGLERQGSEPDKTRFTYSFDNLGPHGDMLNTFGTRDFPAQSYGLTESISNDTLGWRELAAFFSDCRQQGIDCRIGLAPILSSLDLKANEAMQRGLSQIIAIADQYDIPVLDERPHIFFDRSKFFDSSSHLNTVGREERTERLAQAISLALSHNPALD